jgi:hypothetical protein
MITLVRILIIGQGLTGLWAAYMWLKASRIIPAPNWHAEPGEVVLSQQGWLFALAEAYRKSSDLNRKAALWTALSVLFGLAITVVQNFN